jgi:high-affinity iron transporter
VSLRVLESRNRWLVIGVLVTFLVAVLVAQAVAGGVNDPTDPTTRLSHSAVVFDSALLVFREGLECILVLAAFTASFRRLMNGTGPNARRNLVLGLAGLGFASVYREGFEVVLFLQSMRLRYGTGTVLEGVAIAVVLIAAVGVLTFVASTASRTSGCWWRPAS